MDGYLYACQDDSSWFSLSEEANLASNTTSFSIVVNAEEVCDVSNVETDPMTFEALNLESLQQSRTTDLLLAGMSEDHPLRDTFERALKVQNRVR